MEAAASRERQRDRDGSVGSGSLRSPALARAALRPAAVCCPAHASGATAGSLVATMYNPEPLLLSYSFQIRSDCFLFGSLFCVMVFGLFFHPAPAPLPVAGFRRRRLVFGASCKHICSLAVVFQEAPFKGFRSREPGHSWAVGASGQAQGSGSEGCSEHTCCDGQGQAAGPQWLPKS